ncbi:MAG: hypothetical protein WC756_13735 [Taibaiella sp.]
MSDDEFVLKITQSASGLTPEALVVVKEEIERRKLPSNVLHGLEAQHRKYSNEELDLYCEIIRSLPCPISGLRNEKLNASLVAEALSFIVITNHKKYIAIGNPESLDKINNASLIRTLLLGWWGLPWGPIKTIQAMLINLNSKKTNHASGPNDFLRIFVQEHIGEIAAYKDDSDRLFRIISGC